MPWNPSDKSTGITLTSSNDVATVNTGSASAVRGTTSHVGGKWYLEFYTCNQAGNGSYFVGLGQAAASLSSGNAGAGNVAGFSGGGSGFWGILGNFFNATGIADPDANRQVDMAFDFEQGLFWVRVANGNWNNSGTANPATGVGGFSVSGAVHGTALFPMMAGSAVGATATLNTGDSAFVNAMPASFKAWDFTAWTTLDPATVGTGVTLSGSNLIATEASTGSDTGARAIAADALNAGKFYFEVHATTWSSGDTGVGICTTSSTYPQLGSDGTTGAILFRSGNLWTIGANNGNKYNGTSVTNGDFIDVAVDLTAGLVWTRKGGTANWNNSGTSSPATGVGGISYTPGTRVPCGILGSSTTDSTTFNFGLATFNDKVPIGFVAGWPASGTPPPTPSSQLPVINISN